MELNSLLFEVSKPPRYTGGEWNSVVKAWDKARLRLVLLYPDLYEIGMSNLAIPILYHILNSLPGVACERAYAPWPDMGDQLRRHRLPLFSLESRHPLREFDVLGFSLGYELAFTNVLYILDLAGVPLLSAERDGSHPIVLAGGSAALNPEPMADFIDAFFLGEGEEGVVELAGVLLELKGAPRRDVLRTLARIPGIYVPSLYYPEYRPDDTLSSFSPTAPEAPPRIERRLVDPLPPPTTRLLVPFVEAVHDRGMVEVQRGCLRGCRFCQAGIIYRPRRERPPGEVIEAVGGIISACGYNEVSLVSLSTSDYPGIEGVVEALSRRYPDLLLSLPSLRLDEFSVRLMGAIPRERKKGLTFAPEAGTERLRAAINKGVSHQDILNTLSTARERGWTRAKLYFMAGLPTETPEDIDAIAGLVGKIARLPGGGRFRLKASLSPFVPKPHTPFQWAPQVLPEEMEAKIGRLRAGLRRWGVPLSYHDPRMSLVEGLLSRGDRRLGRAILYAYQGGCLFDSWKEHFRFERWQEALKAAGLSPSFYTRERGEEELLPWGFIDVGVTPGYLRRELRRAFTGEETPDCRHGPCSACGLHRHHPKCRERAAEIGQARYQD